MQVTPPEHRWEWRGWAGMQTLWCLRGVKGKKVLKRREKNKLCVQNKKKAEQEKIKGSKEIQLDPQRALILLIQLHPSWHPLNTGFWSSSYWLWNNQCFPHWQNKPNPQKLGSKHCKRSFDYSSQIRSTATFVCALVLLSTLANADIRWVIFMIWIYRDAKILGS